jgi:hypothetical protein
MFINHPQERDKPRWEMKRRSTPHIRRLP